MPRNENTHVLGGSGKVGEAGSVKLVGASPTPSQSRPPVAVVGAPVAAPKEVKTVKATPDVEVEVKSVVTVAKPQQS